MLNLVGPVEGLGSVCAVHPCCDLDPFPTSESWCLFGAVCQGPVWGGIGNRVRVGVGKQRSVTVTARSEQIRGVGSLQVDFLLTRFRLRFGRPGLDSHLDPHMSPRPSRGLVRVHCRASRAREAWPQTGGGDRSQPTRSWRGGFVHRGQKDRTKWLTELAQNDLIAEGLEG